MAGKACHGFGSTTQVGLTQVLDLSMRNHGNLTKWNDERGFGFITPAGGVGEIFVHVSASPVTTDDQKLAS